MWRTVFIGLGAVLASGPAFAASETAQNLLEGVTFYGHIDIGYGYQTSGVPLSSGGYVGMNYNAWAAPAGRKSMWSLTANAWDVSNLGVRVEKEIAGDWKAVAKLDTGFNPLYGVIADHCSAIVENNGRPDNEQTVGGDANRCGQTINGDGYVGLANPALGRLTVGRQTSLATDVLADYDASWESAAFSLIGWSGGLGGGTGATAAVRWDQSLKYTYAQGLVRAQVMFTQGGQDTALHGQSWAANIGTRWRGFSVDVVHTSLRNAVSAGGFGFGQCGGPDQPGCDTLNVTGQNNRAWALMGRYVHERSNGAKLTTMTGYQHIRTSDPSDPLSVGDRTIGGYAFGAVTNDAFRFGHRDRAVAWLGSRYESGPWTFTAAYYRATQDFHKTSASEVSCSGDSAGNCSGTLNTASATASYAFNRHFDVYAGTVWSNLHGGFASGYPEKENTVFLNGIRLRF